MVLATQIRNAAKRIPMIKFRAGKASESPAGSAAAPGSTVSYADDCWVKTGRKCL